MVNSKKDMSKAKRTELERISSRSGSVVSFIRNAISSLEKLNGEIKDNVADIEDYQYDLEETKKGLVSTLDANSQMIKNFKTLLGEEDQNG